MFGAPGYMELIVLGVIGLLLFGKRLPEVARSLGKGIVEFKKGMSGIEDEVRSATSTRVEPSIPRPAPATAAVEPAAPKFEPPTVPPA